MVVVVDKELKEVRVLIATECEECRKVRERHGIRTTILQTLKDSGFPIREEDIENFRTLAHFGRCPLHRNFTVFPSETLKKDIEFKDGRVVFLWWTNNNSYRVEISPNEIVVYNFNVEVYRDSREEIVRQTLIDALKLSDYKALEKLREEIKNSNVPIG